MKLKTSELEGDALGFAVALCLGYSAKQAADVMFCDSAAFAYHTEWAKGGPIIEREEISIHHTIPAMPDAIWQARPSLSAKGAGGKWGVGPTPLIAAMRCFVASKLGDEVAVPEELA